MGIPFRESGVRLVKEMAHEVDPDARVQAQLLDRLEQVVQQDLSGLVGNTVRAAQKEKRKTMMVKDLDFIMEIRDSSGKQSVNLSGMSAPATAASSN